jgi:hypothetical protein
MSQKVPGILWKLQKFHSKAKIYANNNNAIFIQGAAKYLNRLLVWMCAIRPKYGAAAFLKTTIAASGEVCPMVL